LQELNENLIEALRRQNDSKPLNSARES